jgi:hypothetical protein
MANSPYVEVALEGGAEAAFLLGAEDDPDSVADIDVTVTLADGSRWSASLMTLGQIARVMAKWRVSGECLGGSYFQCQDLVIVEHGGIPAMTRLLNGLLVTDDLRNTLVRLDESD